MADYRHGLKQITRSDRELDDSDGFFPKVNLHPPSKCWPESEVKQNERVVKTQFRKD
jgi:hypothetical protein